MEADNQIKINQGAFITKKTALEETISTLSKKHQELLAEHREKEQELRKVCYSLITSLAHTSCNIVPVYR